MALSPIMTSLTAYVEQRRLPLIAEAVLKARSASLFNLQTDIKTSAALNLLETTVEFGDGLTCGWNEAGSQTLSQRILETGNIKINMAYCDKEMLKYWTQYEVRVAAGQKTLPFEEDFVNAVIANVKAAVEKAIWQGDKASGDANLNKFNGLIKIIEDAAGVNNVTFADGAAAKEIVANVLTAIPAAVYQKNDVVIMMGTDMYRKYVNELVAENLFHYNPGTPIDEVIIPGTNVKVIGLAGLDNTGKVVAGSLSNFFYGTDMVNNEEKFELWYSQDFREFRLAIEFNAGVQIAYPSEIVYAKKA